MSLRRIHSRSSARWALFLAVALLFLAACGTEEYQKPVQQFRDATSVVTSATRIMLSQINVVEHNAQIDQAVFEHKEINLPEIRDSRLVSDQEIAIRAQALDQLDTYVSNLVALARGQGISSITAQTTNLSNALDALSKQVSVLPVSSSSFIKNKDFGVALHSAASVIGNLARLFAEHKARAELEKSIAETKQPIDTLLGLLEEELSGAYERQKATLSAQQVFFARAYEHERTNPHADPNSSLLLGDRLKSYLQQRAAMESADPQPSLDAMRKAHAALVNYAQTKHDPKSLRELLDAVQGFVDRVKPFADALRSFMSMR